MNMLYAVHLTLLPIISDVDECFTVEIMKAWVADANNGLTETVNFMGVKGKAGMCERLQPH